MRLSPPASAAVPAVCGAPPTAPRLPLPAPCRRWAATAARAAAPARPKGDQGHLPGKSAEGSRIVSCTAPLQAPLARPPARRRRAARGSVHACASVPPSPACPHGARAPAACTTSHPSACFRVRIRRRTSYTSLQTRRCPAPSWRPASECRGAEGANAALGRNPRGLLLRCGRQSRGSQPAVQRAAVGTAVHALQAWACVHAGLHVLGPIGPPSATRSPIRLPPPLPPAAGRACRRPWATARWGRAGLCLQRLHL